MKNSILFCWLVFAMVTIFTSCKKSEPVAAITKTIVLPANGAAVVNSSNSFAYNFLNATVMQDSSVSNKLISPLSIYIALSMAYNGAGAATRDSMAVALQLSGLNIDDLNTVCNSLISQLPQEDNRVQFSIANSIWYNENTFQPLPSFLSVLQKYYNATAQPLNFSDDASAAAINNWAAMKTNNKISKIIDHISPEDLMYLINAIYFNGKWQFAFKASNTRNDNFYLPDGSITSVPFMQQNVTVNIFADSLFSMIELPYGSGKSYSMYIAIPTNRQMLANTFVSLINKNILESDIEKMDSAIIQVTIPKWEYSYNIEDMKPELTALGMGIAFTDNADFSSLYSPGQVNPKITKAIHKTYIKVDEEGTEAAAVTAVGFGYTAVSTPQIFKADHPFLYIIKEKQTGTIVFAGVVNDPSKN